MKKVMPFILIAIIVGGALFFLNDDYEKTTYNPIATTSTESLFWEVTFFLEDGEEEGEYDLGLILKPTKDELDIEAIEFFFLSPYGGFHYQDLDMEDFTEEIIYSEACSYCAFDQEPIARGLHGDFYADVTINWKENGEVNTDQLYTTLDFDEQISK